MTAAFATGVGIYFALPFEPRVAFPFVIAGLAGTNFVIHYRRFKWLAAAFAFCVGFFYAIGFSQNFGTPGLHQSKHDTEITGTAQRIDYANGKTRVFLVNANALKHSHLTIRVTVAGAAPCVGCDIKTRGAIFAPNGADANGGFDFAEWAYFNGINATGYIPDDQPIEITRSVKSNSIDALREKIHASIPSGHPTTLVDSLVLGYSNALPADENDPMKAAGVNHVFSISGFHISLISGWLFILFYGIFRLFPFITRRIPARYPAAACAWLGLLFYLQLSGSMVATMRSFWMASLVMLAAAAGRSIFTLRNIALVFTALLFANPHYLMDAGFQMSFSAIFGLMYFFGDAKFEKRGWLQKVCRAIVAIALSSIIATAFTAPFVAFNFHLIQVYGLLGNMTLLPIFSVLIMPLVIVGVFTAQIGWFFPLTLASHIYEFTLSIARWIQSLPFSVVQVPIIQSWALALIIFGILIFVLARGKYKWFATAAFAIAIMGIALRPRAIFYSTDDAETVAFMTDGGDLKFNKRSSANHNFAFETFEYLNFQKPSDREDRHAIGDGFDGKNYSVNCDEDKVCIYTTPQWRLAYVPAFVPLAKSVDRLCRSMDSQQPTAVGAYGIRPNKQPVNFIVSYFHIIAPNCGAKILSGGFVIYGDGSVEQTNNNRVWHVKMTNDKMTE